MTTKEYLEKLNKAIPAEPYSTGGPSANDMRIYALESLKENKDPPELGDTNAPTIKVITESGCSNQTFNWFHVGTNKKIIMASLHNSILTGRDGPLENQAKIKENHVHLIWRHTATEALIHLGESNIKRAIYEIAVHMLSGIMKEGLLRKVFDPYDDDYSENDGDDDDDERLVRNPSNLPVKRRRIELPLFVKALSENARDMITAPGLTFQIDDSDDSASSLPLFSLLGDDFMMKILLFLTPTKIPSFSSKFDNMTTLFNFGLASKHCYRVYQKALREVFVKEFIQDDKGYDAVVHVHHIDSLFKGISNAKLAKLFDALIWRDGNGGCVLCPNGDIVIRETSSDCQDKLEVHWKCCYCG